MRIIDQEKKLPTILETLSGIGNATISYQYFELRHPGGIYNISLQSLTEVLLNLGKLLKNRGDHTTIGNLFKLTIYEFFKFYDSFYEIMLAFAKKEAEKPRENEFLHVYFSRKNYKEPKNFFNNITNSISDIRSLYNSLKHSSSRLNIFNVATNQNKYYYGYFLEISGQNGQIISDSSVYPISLALEIRRIYYLIYYLSNELENTIKSMHQNYWQSPISPPVLDIGKQLSMNELYNLVKDFPTFFYPREIGQKYIMPNLEERNSNLSITFNEIEITKELLRPHYRDGGKISQQVYGDGYSSSFKFNGIGNIEALRT